MPNDPRSLRPVRSGDPYPPASTFEALRRGAAKRIRGLIGRESATRASFTDTDQSIRDRVEVLAHTDVEAYSLFAVKRSADLDYFWEPILQTESFLFEHGFLYVTNGDFYIAAGESYHCETVGHLPVIIRYESADGVPKIGHPIGPLESGKVSVKRAGFVVVGTHDDTEELVWVTRAASHDIRAKIVTNILPGERGEIEVQDDELCDQNAGVKDPDKATPTKPFVIREVLNLTGVPLLADTFHYAKPILGVGYAIVGEYDPIFKVEAQDCFYPEDEAEFLLYQLNVITDEFEIVPNVTPTIKDNYGRFMLLAGEVVDAAIYLDECGIAKFKLIGSYGLTRQAKVKDFPIACLDTGEVYILGHQLSSCTGAGTCFVTACNGQANEEGRRTLCVDEIVTVIYFESTWKILAHPHVTEWLGTLTANMCPDDATGSVSIDQGIGYCTGVCSNDSTAIADNLFTLSGVAGKRVLLSKYIDSQTLEETYFIKQVQHNCKNIVVPQGECGSAGQGPTDGKFLTYESCIIKGNVLYSTSQMYCGTEALVNQIELTEYDAVLDIQHTYDNCVITLNKYYTSFCAFEPAGNAPADDSEVITFDTDTVYADLSLRYDSGDPSAPSGQDGVTCSVSPSLSLYGRSVTAITCGAGGGQAVSIWTLPLTLSTAYYMISSATDSSGRKCISLVPTGFVTFGDCEDGDPEELICGNPCPTDSGPSAS